MEEITMNLTTHKLSVEQSKEISTWKYTREYSIYNLPSWDEIVKKNYSLCDDIKREKFIGYTNENNELVGFISLLDKGTYVSFGIGIKPSHCGNGLGKIITKLAIMESKKRSPNKPIVLEVRTWN